MRLRANLLAVSLATLLPLALFALAAGYLLAQRERDAFQRGATERVRAVMTAVDVELRGSVSTLEGLAVLPEMDVPNLEAMRPAFERLLKTQPGWINFVVTTPQNRQLLNLLVPRGQPIPPSIDHETVARAVATRKSTISDLVRGAALNRPIITIRTPVIRDGEVKFVITAVIDAALLKQILDRQSIPADWLAAIVDGKYRFIVRVPAAPGDDDEVSPSLRRALASANEGWQRGSTLGGGDAYRAFVRSSYSGWSVSMAIPRATVERAGREAALLIGLGALLAMAAGVALALLVARRISAPIAALAAAAPRLGHGEAAAPPDTKVDEVRELAAALQDAGRAIRERESELRAADRAKDEFLAMLGHELRNPLATLSTAAELLRLGRGQPAVLDNAQALIARQTAHMARLVDDLLEVGRVTGGKIRLDKAPLDLAALASRVAATWLAAGRLQKHRLAQSLQPAWIHADAARLEQIVSNLLDNAVKYTPEGGNLSLTVRRAGAQAVLEVADDGQGLAPELIDRVFELFVQGERGLARQQGGLGIGLTLVKRLTELHGGAARARSPGVGQGATFTVEFPAIEAPGATAAPVAETGARAARSILVVDDNRDARESLARLLELSGHRVRTAADGAEAIRLAAQERPEVALVDIGLPDMSGYDVAAAIRAQGGPRVFLAALTGYGRDEDREAARRAGFDAHLTKPVELAALERLVAGAPADAAVLGFPRRRA